jgi:hypothetical protein
VITPLHLYLLAGVALLGVLYYKGYLDDLLGNAVATKAKPSSDKLFEKAIVVALEEAKDKQTQALVQTLKAKVEEVVSNPFAPAGATPPAPPAPANTPSAAP